MTESSPEVVSMHHQDPRYSPVNERLSQHPHDLFLKSVVSGNAFALTKLGRLSEQEELSVERAKQGLAIFDGP